MPQTNNENVSRPIPCLAGCRSFEEFEALLRNIDQVLNRALLSEPKWCSSNFLLDNIGRPFVDIAADAERFVLNFAEANDMHFKVGITESPEARWFNPDITGYHNPRQDLTQDKI